MKAVSKKSTILKELEELGVEWMRSKLQDVYASTIIDGDMDLRLKCLLLKTKNM